MKFNTYIYQIRIQNFNRITVSRGCRENLLKIKINVLNLIRSFERTWSSWHSWQYNVKIIQTSKDCRLFKRAINPTEWNRKVRLKLVKSLIKELGEYFNKYPIKHQIIRKLLNIRGSSFHSIKNKTNYW